MKKILALILCALCVVTTAVACQKPEDSKFTLACPDGAPAISALAISEKITAGSTRTI